MHPSKPSKFKVSPSPLPPPDAPRTPPFAAPWPPGPFAAPNIDRFLKRFTERVDLNTSAFFAWVYTARWLGLRLDMVVIMVLTASCFLSVAVSEYSDSVGKRGRERDGGRGGGAEGEREGERAWVGLMEFGRVLSVERLLRPCFMGKVRGGDVDGPSSSPLFLFAMETFTNLTD